MTGAVLRLLRRDELDRVLDWAAAEGWNPGLEDAGAFHATDPEGFFAAEAEGRLVAAVSVVNHAPDYAFLGLYICAPGWRGKGIGHALWRYALAHAGDRCVGLDGVAAQEANYRRSGFARAGATTRYLGRLAPGPCPGLRAVSSTDGPALDALDTAANGVARPRFLAEWLADTPTRRSFVLERGAGICGLVTVRRCRRGLKAGPLLAPDAGAGMAMLSGALAAFIGPEGASAELAIDLPQGSPLALSLAQEGFAPGFTTARMYRGEAPVSGAGLLAIATMELG